MRQFHKSNMFTARSACAGLLVVAFFVVVGYASIHLSFGITSKAPTTNQTVTIDPDTPASIILVKYKAGIAAGQLAEIQAKINSHSSLQLDEIAQLRIKIIKVPDSVKDIFIQSLGADPNIEYAEPEVIRYIDATTPNDPLYKDQWAWPKIQMNAAWDKTKGSASTVIAVLDSGINFSHPDLAGKTVAGYDYVNNDSDPSDDNGHGSWVSGTVSAVTDNGLGISGGCWSCKIMPVKVQNAKGTGSSTNAAKGLRYAADHGAKVINMSFGGGTASKAEEDAINYAVGKGVVVVASAGNDKVSTKNYPASFVNAISVAATDQSDLLTSYSNFASTVDIAAPGNITSTNYPGTDYKSINGTSFSAPIVASVAALLVSAYPKATVAQVTTALTSSTDVCCNNTFAHGRVNAAKALANLAGIFPTTPVTPPTPPTPGAKSGDLNGDSKVNLNDMSILLSLYNTSDSRGDLNHSGKVDLADLSVLLSNWTG